MLVVICETAWGPNNWIRWVTQVPYSDRERRKIAIAFEKLVREAAQTGEQPAVDESEVEHVRVLELDEPRRLPESPMEMMARVWGAAPPWRDRGVDPADGHAHTNVKQGQPLSSWPGSPVTAYSRPRIPPPSDDAGLDERSALPSEREIRFSSAARSR